MNQKRKKLLKGPVAVFLLLILLCAFLPALLVRVVTHVLCLDGEGAPSGVTLLQGEIVGPPSINAVTILGEFQRRGSPAELQTYDIANHIVDDSNLYQIDDAFAVALWAEESQDGKEAIPGTRNIGNMTGPTGVTAVGHTFTIFPSWEDGIDAWFGQAATYVQRGLTDVQSFSLYYVDGILNPTDAQIAQRQSYIDGIRGITQSLRSLGGGPGNQVTGGPGGPASLLNEIRAAMPQYWATAKVAQVMKSVGLFVSCIYNRYVKAAWNLALHLVEAAASQAASLAAKFVNWSVQSSEQFIAWIENGKDWSQESLAWIEQHTSYVGKALQWILGTGDADKLIKMALQGGTDPLTLLSHAGIVRSTDFAGSVFTTATGLDLPLSFLRSSARSWWDQYKQIGPNRITAGPGGGLPQPGDTVVVDDSAQGGNGHLATVLGVSAPEGGHDGTLVVAQSGATSALDAWTIHPDFSVDTNWSYHPKVLGYIRPADLSFPVVPGSAGAAVQYADSHWNWPFYNRSTPAVPEGVFQADFACAEFVARALSAAGLIPGLNPNSPQWPSSAGEQTFAQYRAPNGKTYYLWNTGKDDVKGLYDYLIESGLGTDIGDHPTLASPGDVVFYYGGGTLSARDRTHTAIMVQTGTTSADARVDAHNTAEYHTYYAMEHPLTIVHLRYSDPLTPTPTSGQNANGLLAHLAQSAPSSLMHPWQPQQEGVHRQRRVYLRVRIHLLKGGV